MNRLSHRSVVLILALCCALGGITTVLALDTSSALYTANIRLLNLGLTRQNFAAASEVSGSALIDDGFMASDTLNGVVHQGASEVPSMPPNNRIVMEDCLVDDGGSATDWQTECQDSTEVDWPILPATPAVNDAVYFACDNPCRILTLDIGQEAIADTLDVSWEYYNGTTFVTASNVNDRTAAFTLPGQRTVSFDMPSDMATTSVTGSAVSSAYWVRARVTAVTSPTQQAIGNQAWYENGQWWIWGQSQSINQQLLYNMSVGGPDLVTHHQIFPGTRGITSSDSASMELGDTYTIHFGGALNFTAGITGSDVCVVCKDGAIGLWLSGPDELTLEVTGASTTTLTLGGISDPVDVALSTAPNTLDVISDGTDLTLSVDGVGSVTGAAQTVVDNSNDWTWGRNQAFTFADTIYIMPDDSALAFQLFDTEAEWDTGTLTDTVSTGGAPAFTEQFLVEASADDGYWIEDGTFNNSAASTLFGHNGIDAANTFHRFDNIRIDQGATIVSADLVFSPSSASSATTVDVTIAGVDDDDASAPSTEAAAEALTRTTAVTSWNSVPSWVSSPITTETSPDITDIIQEIVNRPGWTYGNAMVLLVEDNGSSGSAFRSSCSFEAQCESVRLEITIDTGQTFSSDFIEMDPTAENSNNAGALQSWTHACGGTGCFSRVYGLDVGANSKARFGVKSFRLRAGNTVGTSSQIYQDINAAEGEVWSFGINFARTASANDMATFEITFRDSPGGSTLQTNTANLPVSASNYQTASINNITAPSGTQSIRVRVVITCGSTCGSADGVWIDGLMAAQDTTAPNWPDSANELLNSSFEQVYTDSSTWESPTINLTQTSVASSSIVWDAFSPIDAEMTVYTNLNSAGNVVATNGGTIPGIAEGADVSGQTLQVTVTMTGSSPDLQVFSPWNSFLAVLVNDDVLEDNALLYYQLRTTPGVTIPDLSPNGNDGTMSYPVQLSGIFSSSTPFTSNLTPLSAQAAIGVGDFTAPVTGAASNTNLFGGDTGDWLPFGQALNGAVNEANLPIGFFWALLVFIAGIAAGAAVWKFTQGNTWATTAVLCGTLVLAAAVGNGVIPGWVPFVSIMMYVPVNILRSRLPI